MTKALFHLGRLCVRHRWIVLAVWLLIFVGLAHWARALGPNVSDNLTLPGTDSNSATDLLEKRFPSQANGMNPVVLRAPDGEKISAAKFKTPIDDTVKAFKADPDVRSASSPLASGSSGQLSKNESIGYVALNLRPSSSELTLDDANRIVALADPARHAGLEVGFGGYLGQKVSKPDTHSSEVIGLGMAVIVLLFTFGTVVAMGLPIFTAIIGLVCGLSIITVLSHVAIVPTVAPTLATMIGLGVGIDYALFIVTRHLQQRGKGMETRESIARAVASSGGAVVFAGSTVMVALLSLAVVGIPLVTTLGYTSAMVVAVAVLGAITLLPAVLGLVGDGIDRLRIPMPHGKADDHPHGWLRWGGFVARHPLPCALVAIVVLAVLALPTLDLYLGQQDNRAMPESTDARRASDGMTAGFGAGTNGPLLVSVDMSRKPAKADQANLNKLSTQEQDQKDKANQQAAEQEQQIAAQLEAQGMPPAQAQAEAQSQVQPQLDKQISKIEQQSKTQRKKLEQTATDPRLQDLKKDIAKASGVKKVSEPLVNSDGTAAVLNATPTTDPSDQATADLVDRLRDTTIPKAEKGNDMTVNVGGQTAGYVDLASEISSRLILTIAVVVAPELRAAAARVPLDRHPAHRRAHEPHLDRSRVRRRHRRVREGLGRRPRRARGRGADRLVRAADDVRDPVRALDGLRGVPDDPHPGALARERRQQAIGHRGRRHHRPRDHLRGADHGQRVLRLHHQRRPHGQAVRRRDGRRRRGRRDRRALPARARGDGARRQGQLVVPALARPDRAELLDRGRAVVPRS